MDDDPQAQDAKGQLEIEADRWCMRMHGHDAKRLRPEFEAWLRRGALHRSAYNRAEELYLLGSHLDESLLPPLPAETLQAHQSARGRFWLMATAGAAGCAALGAVMLSQRHSTVITEAPPSDGRTDLRFANTGRNAQSIRLRDGSRMLLASFTIVDVRYDERHRAVRLVHGRGRFSVPRDPRPFSVRAGGGEITSKEAVFDVSYTPPERVHVKLISGNVVVNAPKDSGDVRQDRSQQLNVPGSDADYLPISDKPLQATGESRPTMPSQPRTVGDLVEQSNKITADGVRIQLDAVDLRTRELGGTFRTHDPASTAQRLAVMFGLQLDFSQPNLIRLYRATSRRAQ